MRTGIGDRCSDLIGCHFGGSGCGAPHAPLITDADEILAYAVHNICKALIALVDELQ
jgi:hypothetical protein